LQLVFCEGSVDEVGEFVSALDQISLIEDTLGEAAKEAGHSIFKDLSSWAKQCRARKQRTAKIEQVIFVSTGAMQEKQDGAAFFSRYEAMDESGRFKHAGNMDGFAPRLCTFPF
jgi:hypothetical protein